MKKLQVIATSFGAALLFILPALAFAASNGTVSGKPANPKPDNPRTQSIFIYDLKLGESVDDGIQIINGTNQKQTVNLYGVDSVLSSGGAFACAQNADPKNDVGAWIKLSSSSVDIDPNSNQVVPFTVTVPDGSNISVGEHDGCIAIQTASQTAVSSGREGVVLSFRSAIRMVVTIPGKIVKNLNIKSVKVGLADDGNYAVTPIIENNGNVSLDTGVEVGLFSIFNRQISSSKKGATPILPRTQLSQTFEVKPTTWGGLYRVRVTASYNSSPTTSLGKGQGADQQTKQLDSGIFFAMPTPTGAVIESIPLLAAIGGTVWLVKKKYFAKQIRKKWKTYVTEEGDTLKKLAKEFDTSWKKIAKANKLKPPYDLRKGQKLKLPPEKG